MSAGGTRGSAGATSAGSIGIDATSFEVDGATIDCFIVPWDSEIFGFPVAQISRIDLGTTTAAPARLLGAFEDWCDAHGVRLAACRLDHGQLRESMALEAHGFRFVELVYQPRLDDLRSVPPPRHDIHVAAATASDLGAIEAIARSAFTTGRFVLDHRLPPELSGRRYAAWVRSAMEGDRQTVLKAELDGDLAGFFITEARPDAVYWHLTAIAPEWQGKGIGLSMWRTMLRRHAEDGAARVETTISGHNLAALNLYARLGFSFASAQMTFHRLISAPT